MERHVMKVEAVVHQDGRRDRRGEGETRKGGVMASGAYNENAYEKAVMDLLAKEG